MTFKKAKTHKKITKRLLPKPVFHITTIHTESGVHEVPYLLRYSRRAKNISLSQSWGNYLELVLPARVAHREALSFLKDHAQWIEKNFLTQPKSLTLGKYLQKHPYINLLGKMVNVHIYHMQASQGKAQKPYCVYHPGVSGGVELYITHGAEHRTQEIVFLMKQLAARYLKQHVMHLVHKVGAKTPRMISIRDQSSRWGSCSDRKNLSFNWRLLFLEPHIQDYVILHELAHLTHLDHSKRFWDLLATYDPKTREHDDHMNVLAPKIFPLGRERVWYR